MIPTLRLDVFQVKDSSALCIFRSFSCTHLCSLHPRSPLPFVLWPPCIHLVHLRAMTQWLRQDLASWATRRPSCASIVIVFVVSPLVDLISGVCCVPAALVGFVQNLSASSASRCNSIGGTYGGASLLSLVSGRPIRLAIVVAGAFPVCCCLPYSHVVQVFRNTKDGVVFWCCSCLRSGRPFRVLFLHLPSCSCSLPSPRVRVFLARPMGPFCCAQNYVSYFTQFRAHFKTQPIDLQTFFGQ